VTKLDTDAASDIAIEKAVASHDARAIEPGRYTVILEPEASVGLIQNMVFNLNARRADEGRSFMAKPGGGTRVGEQLLDERISITSDPSNTEVPVSPWLGDGRSRERTDWIKNGVVENLYYSRFWAEKQGVHALPAPGNFIMAGGDASLEELIRDTRRGVLVTRTWYIRTVDPQTLLYTGLTRDGTFFIENGTIKHAVKNFRFNESPVIMLNNLDELGRPERSRGYLIPPMRVRDFTMQCEVTGGTSLHLHPPPLPIRRLGRRRAHAVQPPPLVGGVHYHSSGHLDASFAYLAGHRLVQFSTRERAVFERYVLNGGFVFVDDCNHDIDGLFATSFEAQMADIFGPDALAKLSNDHDLYRAFFRFDKGPPATSIELNGWGDDLIHDYLKAITIDGRIGVLYSNKDYGCEWDYDFRNKRFYAQDNTKFGVNIVVHAMTR